MLGNASVAALASDPRLLDIARQVLGAEARPFRATLFDKSPTSNWLVVCHQDTALPLLERHELPCPVGDRGLLRRALSMRTPQQRLEQVLALRVHLDDSSDRNGLRCDKTMFTAITAIISAISANLGYYSVYRTQRFPARVCNEYATAIIRALFTMTYSCTRPEEPSPWRCTVVYLQLCKYLISTVYTLLMCLT
jgi:hypothetical protein